MFEALKDQHLCNRLVEEVETSLSQDGCGFNITKLSEQDLLQSSYAEVLRLRIAIAMTRVNEFADFDLHGYKIPRHQTMLILSRTSALNAEAWTQAGRSLLKPLDEFHAERFLVDSDEVGDATEREHCDKSIVDEEKSNKPAFSLSGLAGCWIPYGGGQRMCPGRHFAKNEILGTFALLFTRYELQLGNVDVSRVQPDFRWYPVGALPPVCKVPFRIRRRA
jgi:cytochrome P450